MTIPTAITPILIRRALACRAWLPAVVCVVFFHAYSAVAQAVPERVPARGAVHDDFGRVVLDWPQQVVVAVKGDGERLVLQFDRPAAIDLKPALANLKDYIAGARLSDGGSTLAIDFTAPVTWRTFSDGPKLVLDFAFVDDPSQQAFSHGPDPSTGEIATESVSAGEDGSAGAPAPKAAIVPRQSLAPLVPVRTGEHRGFSRLAFDWPKSVDYDLVQSGDRLEVRFANPGRIDATRVTADLPTRVKALDSIPIGDAVVVRLQLHPGMVVRDFRSGRTVVVDIYDRGAPNIPAQRGHPASTVAPMAAAPASLDGLAEIPPALAMPEAAPAESQSNHGNGAAPPANGSAALANLEPQLQKVPPQPPAPPATPAGGAKGPGVAAPVASMAPAIFEPPRVAPPPVAIKITALPLKEGATLYFDWPKPVALAVFRRGDAVWLVFDAPGRGDLKPIRKLSANIGKVEAVSSPFAFALRLIGGMSASPAAASEGARWKVTLRPGTAMAPTQSIQQRRETRADGSVLLLVQAIASGAAVDLTDPSDHSRLVVTPGRTAGLGVARESDWPDFKLLPSYQGVVVSRLNDRARIDALPNGVVIATPPPDAADAANAVPEPAKPNPSSLPRPNLPVTASPPATTDPKIAAIVPPMPPPGDSIAVESPSKPFDVVPGLFDAKAWRRGGAASFPGDHAALQRKVDDAAPADRNRTRLDLAEYYFANGYGPEAGGLLDSIRHDDHAAENDPLIMALAAASRTMAGETAAAEQVLAAPILQGVAEANLMRGVIAATKGDAAAAAKLFAGPLPDVSEYPKPFRTRIRLLGAQALIESGDPLAAQNFLDPIEADAPDADSIARAAFLDGQRLMKLGKKDGALKVWAGLADSPIDEIKAKSRFAVVSAKLESKSIDPKDALAQLEALRYLWRGDTFEFDLLFKLGHLYLDTDQPRKGLITLRQAATHFPDHPMAKQAADDMTDAFRKLYLGDGADKLSPLTAVALYDEFRELTPSGPDGDRMIAALADRLVKVDLLDNAADLLERQVKLRLSGTDKTAAGTRLAAIRLLDDKPDLALKALAESDSPAVAPALQDERRRLRARAQFDTGETLKAIALVRDDSSLEGLWLKSDMFWKLREWPSAADALGRLIGAEQAKRNAAAAPNVDASGAPPKSPAGILEKAIAQANAAAAADAAASANPDDASATAPAVPQGPAMDPVLSRLVLNRAVALSLAGDRRGLKDLGRSFGAPMRTTPLADPFQVLTASDSGLTESIDAQMKSVDQLGTFVDEYRKILQAHSLSGGTEPSPDTGPLAPTDKPADISPPDTPPGSSSATPGPANGQNAAPPSPTQPAAQ